MPPSSLILLCSISTILIDFIFAAGLSQSSSLPTFPNIGFLGNGYDLLIGNPHNTNSNFSPDPGYRASIFNLTLYDLGSPTPDGRYQVPMGVSVDLCSACQYGFQSVLSTGTSSFSSSLQQDASFSFSGWGAAFKGSIDFQQVEKTTKDHSMVVMQTQATCCVYTGSLAIFAPPPFTADFVSAVQSMPTTYDPNSETSLDWFGRFIDHFGTAHLTRVSMGGRFGLRYSITSDSYSIMRSSNIDVNVAAGYSALSFSAAASSLTGVNKTQADYFNKQTDDTVKYVVGGSFPASGLFTDWAAQVKDQPMPIRVELASLDSLLNPIMFPDVDSTVLSQKQSALKMALMNYCMTKVAQGVLADCNPPPPDVPPPPPSIFGGMYQYDPCGTNQLLNPYTNGLSCAAGFSHVMIGQVIAAESKCVASIFLCLLTSAGSNDPLGYFGGMFQKDDLDESGLVNPMTGGLNCSDGFEVTKVGRILKSDRSQGTSLFMCTSSSVNYSRTPFGGVFQTGDLSADATLPNPITGAASCPPGYTPYKFGRIIAPEPARTTWGAANYMCINNILPIE